MKQLVSTSEWLIVCKAKLNRARVTHSNPVYHGSLDVDEEILERLGICPYEKVLVVNLTTGARFETYAMRAKRGSRIIGLNGGAAQLGSIGDTIGFVAFKLLPEERAESHRPKILEVGESGELIEIEAK